MNNSATLIFLLALSSCVNKHKVYDKIEMSIKYADSYVYNLHQQTFTVTRISKPDTIIHFELSANERSRIVNKYHELELDNIKGEVLFSDSCRIVPKLYTTLTVNTNGDSQKISIEEGCYKLGGGVDERGKKLLSFLKFTESILKQKPEIKNAPNSDVIYL